ncbi:hypothetical protein RF11_13527 [Thelohanellus kitauei]|uniref:Uncharacterized protein n=1 Tax=Thelohanellus kitauei TaxID=669202 RepID=A0A0C2IPK7_THEKT|nr:hypothetical protein RF11_13527 [Thelohanellus kitauei]
MCKCILFCLLTFLIIISAVLAVISSFFYYATSGICPSFNNYQVTLVFMIGSITLLVLHVAEYIGLCCNIKFLRCIYTLVLVIVILASIPLFTLGIMNLNKAEEIINSCKVVQMDPKKMNNYMWIIDRMQQAVSALINRVHVAELEEKVIG